VQDWFGSGRGLDRRGEAWIVLGCAFGTAIIFVLDWLTGADIRLHVLYVFPLAIIGRYCASPSIVFAAVVLVTTIQIATFSIQALAVFSFITDVLVALAASLLTVNLARGIRQTHLMLIDQATTDPLTRLPNRRAFQDGLDAEIARQNRYGGVFSLAIIDLDGFKSLNDTQGHGAGDAALKLVADILRAGTRASDTSARLGGDEFAVLLPNTRAEHCAALFHQLCATVATRMADAGYPVTASIGHRTFGMPPESASSAMRQTDELMYQAKRRGKNQVTCVEAL
jgi:diguanylate cyclase (GGDEF)-like protein